MKKSQIALEYMLLIGVLLIILTPIIYYSIQTLNYEVRQNQAAEAVKAIAKTADTVYSLGPGNKKFVQITIPSIEMAIGQNEILFKTKIFGGSADIFETTSAPLEAGKIGSYAISSDLQNPTFIKNGIYNVKVEMKDSSVLIGEEIT